MAWFVPVSWRHFSHLRRNLDSNQGQDFVDSVKWHYTCDPVLIRDSSRVHVTYIDNETSASVWGGSFHHLIMLMKGLDA